jgi:tetratricopeptide (TPR) repeat protein
MFCFGQGKIDSLTQAGIKYHDNGEYAKAIEVYKEGLKIDSKSTLLNDELSLSYLHSGDNEKALKHSNFVIKQNKDHLLPSYIAKGSALSNMGKTKRAIKVFKEGIKIFGDKYQLYFNLGITYSKMQDNKNAESAFISSITHNSNHISSHYALAIVEIQEGKRVESLMCLYYFLLLEPSSKRAEMAYSLLKKQLGGNVRIDENDSIKINISFDPKIMKSEFLPAELMIPMLEASNLYKENKDKSPEELFIDNTKSLFSVLGELLEDGKKSNIWWNFYVPFFYDLAKSEYIDVFCYYISASSNKKAREWLKINDVRLKEFIKWVKDN